MVTAISRDALKQKMDRGDPFTLVEALPKTAFEHAHLPGAINLPPDQIAELAPELLPDKEQEIVVYCAKPS
jgi:rhodanese-related sulfurtransferase